MTEENKECSKMVKSSSKTWNSWLSKYKPEYCEMVQQHMARGYSFEAFAAGIGVDRKTLYLWCDKYPEFKYAKDVGTEASRKLWEKVLIKQAKKNVIATIFALKNKFPNEWRDRRELDVQKEETAAPQLSLDEQIGHVTKMLEQLLQIKAAQDAVEPETIEAS